MSAPDLYAKPLPRWRTKLARWLITGKRQLSECSEHYDEYGMPNTNIVGCIWCALAALEKAHRTTEVNNRQYLRALQLVTAERNAAWEERDNLRKQLKGER